MSDAKAGAGEWLERMVETKIMMVNVLIGAIIGWMIGVAQMFAMGSWDFFYWSLMPMFLICSAAPFAFYGMILRGSGLFSQGLDSKRTKEEQSKRERRKRKELWPLGSAPR